MSILHVPSLAVEWTCYPAVRKPIDLYKPSPRILYLTSSGFSALIPFVCILWLFYLPSNLNMFYFPEY